MAIVEADVEQWLDMADGSGSTVTDESGGLGAATIVGATWNSSGGPTNLPKYLAFDGVNDHLDLNNESFIPSAEQSTWAFWLRMPASSDTFLGGVRETSSNNDRIIFRVNINSSQSASAGRVFADMYQTNGVILSGGVDSDTGIDDDVWRHFVVSFDNANSLIYMWMDGSALTVGMNSTSNVALGSTVEAVYLGSWNNQGSAASPLEVDFAQVITFNRVLTTAEVGEIYNGGDGITYDGLFNPAPPASDNALFFGGGL